MTNVVHRDFTDRKPLPAPDSDVYHLVEVLNADELALVKKIRAYMETKVAPIINKYFWPSANRLFPRPTLRSKSCGRGEMLTWRH